MRIDEHDVGRYRRQDQKSGPGKSNNNKWSPLILALVAVVALVAVWRMGIFDASSPAPVVDASSTPAPAPVNNQEVANEVDSISAVVKELAGQVEFLVGANQRDNQQFLKVSNELKQIRNGLGGLDERVKAIEGRLSSLASSVSRANSLASSIERVDSQGQAEIAKLKEINAEITENFEKLSKDIVNLNALYNNQAQSVQQVESYLNSINARVTNLER